MRSIGIKISPKIMMLLLKKNPRWSDVFSIRTAMTQIHLEACTFNEIVVV